MSKFNKNKPNTKENDEDRMFVTVQTDDNKEVETELLTIFNIPDNDQDYAALITVGKDFEPSDDSELLFYRYFEDENGNASIDNIESDEENEAVVDAFDQILDEEAFDEAEEKANR